MRIRLNAVQRDVSSKGALRQLRESGRLPGVLYGHKLQALPIHVPAGDVAKQLRSGRMELMDLEVEGVGSHQVMIADVHRDPINGSLLHIDFQQVAMDKPIKLKIPVELVGTAPGVKLGGVLIAQETFVEVEGLPGVIPPVIEADISKLNVGDTIIASELNLPDGVNLLSSPEDLIASVTVPRGVKEAEETAGEEVAAAGEA